MRRLAAAGLAETTRARMLAAIGAFYRRAVKLKIVAALPTTSTSASPRHPAFVRRYDNRRGIQEACSP